MRLTATYRVRAAADAIEARAEGIAVEQSVEMPPAAIERAYVLDRIVGRVEGIDEAGDGLYDVRIGLAAATVGGDAGQLFNMAFGNSSLQDDVVLQDLELTPALAESFGGPRHGLAGLRRRVGAAGRALTCSAIKPQGLPPEDLAVVAGRFARGQVDYLKDDHGLADQAYSPFEARVAAVAAAVADAADETGHPTRYLPSLSGDLDALRRQAEFALGRGLDTLLVAPMLAGPSNVMSLVRSFPEAAFVAHPTFAGNARIAPPALYGKLFRLLGADGVIFPNHGGRFGYSAETCRALAETARASWAGFRPSLPIPAGGMTLQRVPEMLDFYGPDVMLLIGGALLLAREGLAEACRDFTAAVAGHRYKA